MVWYPVIYQECEKQHIPTHVCIYIQCTCSVQCTCFQLNLAGVIKTAPSAGPVRIVFENCANGKYVILLLYCNIEVLLILRLFSFLLKQCSVALVDVTEAIWQYFRLFLLV